mgnify:CR=1 FL=1
MVTTGTSVAMLCGSGAAEAGSARPSVRSGAAEAAEVAEAVPLHLVGGEEAGLALGCDDPQIAAIEGHPNLKRILMDDTCPAEAVCDRQFAFDDPRMTKTESPSLWASLSLKVLS